MSFGPKKKPTGMTGGKPREVKLIASEIKKLIQAKLRENAIERDKTCVIGQYTHWLPYNWRLCGPLRKDGQIIVQAEHLVGRANSASYADMDNIVLLCMRHHFHFKKQHGALYWELIKRHIGEHRWNKVQLWERDQVPHHMVAGDWRIALEKL